MTYRVRNIFVAVGLAVVAALLTTFYVANYKRHVRQAESTVTVYVAKKDIPAGTLGSALAGNRGPRRNLEPRADREPRHLPGRVLGRADHPAALRDAGPTRHPLPAARPAARDLGRR